MRGISRSGFFKNHGLEKSKGAPTASLPPGTDATHVPVISGVNALLYNPKNLPYGSVTPEPVLTPALRSNLKAIAKNSIKKPSVIVVFTAHHAPNTELFVSVMYSKYNNFPSSDVKEKNLRITSNSAVTFSLNDLLPGTTYYIRTQARSIATGISSVWTPASPIIVNTPIAPTNGVFGGVYHIDGEATSLSLNGTGEWEGDYYINGQVTEFDELDGFGWSGVYNGIQYYNGAIADGYINTKWWYNGVESSQAFYSGGNGFLNGLFFQEFAPVTGFYNGNWYTQGVIKPGLNPQGNGAIDDLTYVAGAPYTGTLNGIYYIKGEATSLSPGGTGTWNGQFYSYGAYIGDVGNPYDAGQTSSQGSRFSSGVTYG